MKTTFIAPNGIKVEGIVLYTSPIAKIFHENGIKVTA